jgi:hypothetical protein
MSTFTSRTRACRACGTDNEHSVAVSLNGDRMPELRDQILDGTFQRFACVNCGSTVRIEDPMVYIDFERKEWLTCFPTVRESEWHRLELEPLEDWKEAMITHAAPIARKMSAGFKVRAVFGFDALREKLLCFQHAVEDGLLEVLKFDLVRSVADIAFVPNRRLRLYAVDGDTLWFGVTGTDRTLPAPRSLLTEYAMEPLEWLSLTERLRRGPYVDLGRIMLPPMGAAPS